MCVDMCVCLLLARLQTFFNHFLLIYKAVSLPVKSLSHLTKWPLTHQYLQLKNIQIVLVYCFPPIHIQFINETVSSVSKMCLNSISTITQNKPSSSLALVMGNQILKTMRSQLPAKSFSRQSECSMKLSLIYQPLPKISVIDCHCILASVTGSNILVPDSLSHFPYSIPSSHTSLLLVPQTTELFTVTVSLNLFFLLPEPLSPMAPQIAVSSLQRPHLKWHLFRSYLIVHE